MIPWFASALTITARAMAVRFQLGMFDPPDMVPASKLTVATVVDTPAHRALARQAAVESIVILRNQPPEAAGRHATNSSLPLLPFANSTIGVKHIAVVGPNANRTMSLVSNYPGCKNSPGGPLDPDCVLINPLQVSWMLYCAVSTVELRS